MTRALTTSMVSMVSMVALASLGHGENRQDINNTATPMLMRDAIHRSYIPSMEALVETLRGCCTVGGGIMQHSLKKIA